MDFDHPSDPQLQFREVVASSGKALLGSESREVVLVVRGEVEVRLKCLGKRPEVLFGGEQTGAEGDGPVRVEMAECDVVQEGSDRDGPW